MLLMMLSAVVFHELGHVLLFYAYTRRPPSLRVDRFGLRLVSDAPLLSAEEFMIAAAGPAVNLALGLLLCRMGDAFFFSLGTMHFLFALFNLLPYEGADGGRMLLILLRRFFSSRTAEGIFIFASAGTLAFFYFLSLYLFYFTGEGLIGVFFAAFSFPWHKVERNDDF